MSSLSPHFAPYDTRKVAVSPVISRVDPRDWLCTLLSPSFCIFCGLAVSDFSSGSVCRRCWAQICPLRADCIRCGQQYAAGACDRCSQCRDLAWVDVARSYGPYRTELGIILRRYKYRGDLSLAAGLAALLTVAFELHFGSSQWDLLTPVPTHPARVRERGFDHLTLLGAIAGKHLSLPSRTVLAKRLPSRPQAGLSERQRRRNVRGSFSVKHVVTGRRLLLLDDIFTTGATVNECARVLRNAGAVSVGVLTVARAE